MNKLKNLMSSRFMIWFLAFALLNSIAARKTLFVTDISMHGDTYPQYASNPEYDV